MSEYTLEDEFQLLPRTVSVPQWQEYLGRRLSKDEMKMLREVRYELHINKMMKELEEVGQEKNLFIPGLTGLYGNCLFESLHYHGIGDSVTQLRQTLAYFLYQFQDFPNLFPGSEATLKDMFTWTNEVEYVKCHTDNKIYKYTYNVMCQDLCDDCSWTKIPTEIILRVISLLYEVEIQVISNMNDWVNTINTWQEAPEGEKKEVRTLWIGHLGEAHYVPLDTKEGLPEEPPSVMYNEALQDFNRWANYEAQQKYRQKKIRLEHRRMIQERERHYRPSNRHRNRHQNRHRWSNRFQALDEVDPYDAPETNFENESDYLMSQEFVDHTD